MMKKIISIFLFSCFALIASAQTTFNLATYNVRYKNEGDKQNQWKYRIDHLKSQIEYYEFDIFGTQEGLKEQLDDLAQLKDFKYFGLGRDDGKDAGEHSAIFYKTDKFELLNSGNFWLSQTPDKPSFGWDAQCKRICTWGLFEDKLTKTKFYVFNLHFDHKGVLARSESAKLVLSKIKEINTQHLPLFLCGDFNLKPQETPILTIKKEMKDARDISITPPYGPEGTANGFDLMRKLDDRIDYVFTQGDIHILKYAALSDTQDNRYPSDHLPVVVRAEIK